MRLLTHADLIEVAKYGVTDLIPSTQRLSCAPAAMATYTGMLDGQEEVALEVHNFQASQLEQFHDDQLHDLVTSQRESVGNPWLQRIHKIIRLESAVAVVTTRTTPFHEMLGAEEQTDEQILHGIRQICLLLIKLQLGGGRLARMCLGCVVIEASGDIVLSSNAEILLHLNSERALVPTLISCFIEYLLQLGEEYRHIQAIAMAVRGIAISIQQLPDSESQLGLLVQALGKNITKTPSLGGDVSAHHSEPTPTRGSVLDSQAQWKRPADAKLMQKTTRYFRRRLKLSLILTVVGVLVVGSVLANTTRAKPRTDASQPLGTHEQYETTREANVGHKNANSYSSARVPTNLQITETHESSIKNLTPQANHTGEGLPSKADVEFLLQKRGEFIEWALMKESTSETGANSVTSPENAQNTHLDSHPDADIEAVTIRKLLSEIYVLDSAAFTNSLAYTEQLKARNISILKPVVAVTEFTVLEPKTDLQTVSKAEASSVVEVELKYTMHYQVNNGHEMQDAEESEDVVIQLNSTSSGWRINEVSAAGSN